VLWSATGFSPVFGEKTALTYLDPLHQKDIDWAKTDLNHRRNKPINCVEVFPLIIYCSSRWPARS
jgi:hypothetical protein